MSLQDRLKEQDRLKNRKKLTTGGGGVRDKFKKRDVSTLEKTYENRDKQTKSGSMGKTIFNHEILSNFGIEEWLPHQTVGDHFFDIMPVSFVPHIPYHFECQVHFAVGFAKDAFICPHHAHRKHCYRCEQQAKLYRKKDEYLNEKRWSEDKFKDAAKKLYPQDRIAYLIWKRTEELLGDEPADFTLRVWNAPKQAVHQEIQGKVRDKINRSTLDISDVSPDGEGRTVAMEVTKKKTSAGTFPNYGSFDLHKREKPIPNEILEQLDTFITEAESEGFQNAIEHLLYYADYEEIKESMITEEDDEDEETATKTKNGNTSSLRQRLEQKEEKEKEGYNASKTSVDETLSEIESECEKTRQELGALSSIRFKAWCNKNEYKVALEFDSQSEGVDAIVEDMYEKLIEQADIDI
jgi:hypothetical protein